MIAPTRRGFLAGLGVLIAAPTIVRAASLMPVRALESEPVWLTGRQLVDWGYDWLEVNAVVTFAPLRADSLLIDAVRITPEDFRRLATRAEARMRADLSLGLWKTEHL